MYVSVKPPMIEGGTPAITPEVSSSCFITSPSIHHLPSHGPTCCHCGSVCVVWSPLGMESWGAGGSEHVRVWLAAPAQNQQRVVEYAHHTCLPVSCCVGRSCVRCWWASIFFLLSEARFQEITERTAHRRRDPLPSLRMDLSRLMGWGAGACVFSDCRIYITCHGALTSTFTWLSQLR